MRRVLVVLVSLLLATALGVPATSGPAEARALVGSRVVFVGDFETGDFTQWTQCQTRAYSRPCTGRGGSFYGMQIRESGARQGRYAARFEVRDGDVPTWGGGERSEVSRYDIGRVHAGDERWYQFSMKFGSNFPRVSGRYFLVMQWHGDDNGSPPMYLRVDDRGRLVLDGSVPGQPGRVIGDIARGQWVDYVIHVRFSRSAAQGWAEVYRDGVLVVPRHARANMVSHSNYLKMGIYRDKAEKTTAVVWQDRLRVTAP